MASQYDFLPGNSGYWANGSTGPRPGLGYPGDVSRYNRGIDPLDTGTFPRPRPNAAFGGNSLIMQGSNPGGGYQTPGLGGYGSQNNPLGMQNPTTASSVKSPEFQTAIGNALAQLGQTAFNAATNPNILRDNTKNSAVQAAIQHMSGNLNSYTNPSDFIKSQQFQSNINAGYDQANSDASANRDQYASFKNLFDTQTPSVASNVNQENSSIGEWYDPNGVQAHLDSLAAARGRAVNLSGNRALDRVAKNNALLRMTGGDSSYANHQLLDTSAAIYADEARQQADLARQNYLGVKQGQADLLGARNRGNDYLVNRQTLPINVLTQLGAAQQQRLAGLGAMDLSNNIYTTPAERGAQQLALLGGLSGVDNSNNIYSLDSQQNDLGRRTQLLAQLSALNNANNFYGLQQPYQPNTAGMLNGAPQNWGVVTQNRNNGFVPPPPVQSTINSLTGGYTPSLAQSDNFRLGQNPSTADMLYYQQTGVMPQNDPNFSADSYNTLSGYAARNQYPPGMAPQLGRNPMYAPPQGPPSPYLSPEQRMSLAYMS